MKRTTRPQWDLPALHTHLQDAVNLEFWTIPYYMSALYSIKDQSSTAYQLVQSVVYQEMLHVELAANLANAFGLSPKFPVPKYEGQHIPHLNFALDTPNPSDVLQPYSAEIGPLDEERINGMLLIEFPEWDTGHSPDLQESASDYGSIGEFYDAIEVGVTELAAQIVGGRNQVGFFENYYRNLPNQTIRLDGEKGLPQALRLIDMIREQGEGQTDGTIDMPRAFRNTADDIDPAWAHFKKFSDVKALGLPPTWTGVAVPPKGSRGEKAQLILIERFNVFRGLVEALFRGEDPPAFGSEMAALGGAILNCWRNGAIPRFS